MCVGVSWFVRADSYQASHQSELSRLLAVLDADIEERVTHHPKFSRRYFQQKRIEEALGTQHDSRCHSVRSCPYCYVFVDCRFTFRHFGVRLKNS